MGQGRNSVRCAKLGNVKELIPLIAKFPLKVFMVWQWLFVYLRWRPWNGRTKGANYNSIDQSLWPYVVEKTLQKKTRLHKTLLHGYNQLSKLVLSNSANHLEKGAIQAASNWNVAIGKDFKHFSHQGLKTFALALAIRKANVKGMPID